LNKVLKEERETTKNGAEIKYKEEWPFKIAWL
jgi:hypothetical protein